MKRLMFMAFFISALSSLSFAQSESKPESFVICKLRNQVRTVAVHKKGEIFETIYSKFGKPQVIGSGRSLESNLGFLNNVKTNLSNSGWDCREVTEASIAEEGKE